MKDMKEVTPMWLKQSKNGNVYYEGRLNASKKLLLFPNAWKREPDDPDFRLFVTDSVDPKEVKAGVGRFGDETADNESELSRNLQ